MLKKKQKWSYLYGCNYYLQKNLYLRHVRITTSLLTLITIMKMAFFFINKLIKISGFYYQSSSSKKKLLLNIYLWLYLMANHQVIA